MPFQPLLLIFAIAGLAAFGNFASVARRSTRSANVRSFLVFFLASATETAQRGHVHDAATQIGKQGKENTTTHTHAHTRAQKRQTNIENSKEKRPGKWGTNEGVLVL